MKEFLQWNPIVPGVLLALMIYRPSQRELRWVSVACIAIVAFWFCLAVIRLFSPRLKSLSAPSSKPDVGRAESNLYTMKQVNLWGGYSDVLISGFVRRETPDGKALIRRAGPFLPRITFPFTPMEDQVVVVSEALKVEMEAARIADVTFRPVIYEKIVPIDWHTWNRAAEEPKRYPDGGEPEDYLDAAEHSERTARAMEPAWEVVTQKKLPFIFAHWLVGPHQGESADKDRILVDGSQYDGVFPSTFGSAIIVDATVKRWFEARAAEWVSFQPLKVVVDLGAAQRLEEKRQRFKRLGPHLHLKPEEYRERTLALCAKHGYTIPAGYSRPDVRPSRYCVIQTDASPPKLMARTYDSYLSLSDYLEHRVKQQGGDPTALIGLLIHDLETGKRLRYLGSQEFSEIADES